MTPAGIKANISYYENLVKESHEEWQQHLCSLQYWLDQLDTIEQTQSMPKLVSEHIDWVV